MGAFFSNIQVKAAGASARDKLVNRVPEALSMLGFERTEEPSDRAIIIVWNENSDWLTIYDEYGESNADAMDQLAGELSRIMDTYSVSNLVHDSDLLYMRLYDGGTSQDTYVNDVEMFNEMMGGNRKRNGQAARWERLLPPDVTKKDLSKLWKEETIFAEDKLRELGRLFGWTAEDCSTGYRYWQEDAHHTVSNVRVLYFKDNNPKVSWNLDWFDSDATELEMGVHQYYWECRSHEPGDYVFSVVNIGPTATGLRVMVWGSAIDEGCFESVSIGLIDAGPFSEADETTEVTLQYPDQEEQFKGYAAIYSDCEIPSCTPVGMDPRKLLDQINQLAAAHTYIRIQATPVKSGIFELHASVKPIAEGTKGVTHRLRIFADVDVSPHLESIDSWLE